jgi:hypothetical protein
MIREKRKEYQQNKKTHEKFSATRVISEQVAYLISMFICVHPWTDIHICRV